MPFRLILLALAALCALGIFAARKRKGDYRRAKFYKTFYRPNAFELAINIRRRFGKTFSKAAARALGAGYALTHPRVLFGIRDNIALLDPSRASLRAAFQVCVHQALNFREYAELANNKPEAVLEMLGQRSGIEHIENARKLGKGCLFVTGHFGYFELGGLVMAQLGYRMTTLTLPEPSSELTRWRADFRKRWGVETVVVGNDAFSAVEIVRILRGGAMVALLSDRPFDGNFVLVDLPNGRIPFSTAPVLLSLLSGAPIIAAGIWRQRDGRFHISASPALVPEWLPEGREATIAHFTRKLAQDFLVPIFAQAPEQWHHYSRLQK
jgi:KDO2-lipid IV(A) lauroyltransferase